MKHLGDITKINGAEIEPVWAIIGGSPCQDLSVAGKRAGLAGARSGLFMEQIRVIKEMRQHERDIGRANELIRPRYMVWENVPGAFSSNKGEDFRAVLEETARIADGNADVPQPPNGKWSNAGCIMGNGWSIAWRVHDAQFWGVPQRRRRISLVADFGGQSAPEILFERKGVSGDIAESGTERERTAGDFEVGFGDAVAWYQNGNGECFIDNKAKTVQTNSNASGRGVQMLIQPQIYGFKLGNGDKARDLHDIAGAVQAQPGMKQQTFCIQGDIARGAHFGQNGVGCSTEDVSYTLNTIDRPAVYDARGNGDGATATVTYCCEDIPHMNPSIELSPCLSARGYKSQHYVNDIAAVDCRNGTGGANGSRAEALQILRKNYGEETLFEWADGVLDAIQEEDFLRPYLYGSGLPEEGKAWDKLDDGSLPRPEYVAVWLLRDMWKPEECGCSSQGWKPAKQRSAEPDAVMQELPLETAQGAQELFHMWQTGEGLGLLRETLSEIQKIRRSADVQTQSKHPRNSVRRLTPLEAERLQGYPDGWTDIPGASDSARYKALGNSIALPFWRWMLKRMSAYLPKGATLGSLFDGISGFPLSWAKINGASTCRWSSEIEGFPIAVATKHFGDEEKGLEGDIENFL